MHTPWIAVAKGLPQVSILRNSFERAEVWSRKKRSAFSSPSVLAIFANCMPVVWSMVRSAPPEKLSALPETITQPLMSALAATWSTTWLSSCIQSKVITFIDRSIWSQVSRAIPSASVSKRKFLRFMAYLRSLS
jgi:hypothetical protein